MADAPAPTIGGFRADRRLLHSFDGGDSAEAAFYAPDRYRFFDDTAPHSPRIARGAGLSYCAASFLADGASVSHAAFNRVLDFDSATGEVEVEAGIDLGTLYGFLAARGRVLPCHPGHGAITIGGCIAADVHGKNHVRDATFVQQVAALSLFHPSHGRIELTPEGTADLFELTCGGFGLTGHILTARLRTQPLTSHVVERSSVACNTLAEAIAVLQEVQHTSDYAYTWHDMSRPGAGFGAGFVHSGRLVPDAGGDAPTRRRAVNRAALLRRLPRSGVIGYATTPLLARLYRAKTKAEARSPRLPHYDAVFPIHGAESYFALFGRRGFVEAQWLVPLAQIEALSEHLQRAVRRDRLAIALASAKLFDGPPALLRYSGAGLSLAINLPRNNGTLKALGDLDHFMQGIGARPNLIKDGRLPRAVVEACCPEIEAFRARLHNHDPQRLFRSELSQRLGL